MPHSVAFDLGLHCLSMSHKMDAMCLNGLMALFNVFIVWLVIYRHL